MVWSNQDVIQKIDTPISAGGSIMSLSLIRERGSRDLYVLLRDDSVSNWSRYNASIELDRGEFEAFSQAVDANSACCESRVLATINTSIYGGGHSQDRHCPW